MVAKKKSIFVLACMFMASVLLAAAFAWGTSFAPVSAAERKTYTLPGTFNVYAAAWPNEIDNLEESNQIILHSTANADGTDYNVPAGTSAGFAQNNALGTAGWGLNDLTIKFYLDPGTGVGQVRLYFVNNVSWYNGSSAGFALWLWGINEAAGTANMAIQVKTESGEPVGSIADAASVPINFDYNYFTDTAKDASDEEGQSAAPAEGTLNTWRFYFDDNGMLKLECTAAGKDGAEDRTMTIDLSPEAAGRVEGIDSPQDRLYDFSDLQAGETTNMVVWFADGLKGAMRITEVTSASEETTQGFLPRNYVNATDEPIYGGYNQLGFAKFSGSAANNYSFGATYNKDISFTGITSDVLVDGVLLNEGDVYTMTYTLENGAVVKFDFTKPGSGAEKTALLSGTATLDQTTEVLCEDVEVPFTWEGISGGGGLTHTYNNIKFQKVIDTYVLTVNGETPVFDVAALVSVIGSDDYNCKLTFGVTGSANNYIVIKPLVLEPIEEIDTPAGYVFTKDDNKGIKSLEGAPMFYTTADEMIEVGLPGSAPADSFTVNLSFDKLAENTKSFRVIMTSTSDTTKKLIIELTKTDSNKANVNFLISDNGKETTVQSAEKVNFAWGIVAANEISFMQMESGTARLYFNRGTVIDFKTDETLNSFIGSNFAQGGTFTLQSLGDAKSAIVARGVSELVYMSDPAAGWKPGARNENAEFVYGADGSVGVEHTGSTSQIYSNEIAIGSFTVTLKTHNWTAGDTTFGLQSSSQNTEWFTLDGHSGLIFVLTKHVVDDVTQAGSAVLNLTWHRADNSQGTQDMLTNVVIPWEDDVYSTVSIRKEGDNWVVYVNDQAITTAEKMEGFDQATFNTNMEAAVAEFTKGTVTGNGYFVCYADNTNPGFVTYYKTLTVGVVSIDGMASTIKTNETLQLSATVSPSMALQTGTWSSSDTSIATVDENGLVTGVAEGTVTITFTTDSGAVGTYEVTVSNKTTTTDPGDQGGDQGGTQGGGCSGTVLGAGIAVASAAILAAGALIVVARKRNG